MKHLEQEYKNKLLEQNKEMKATELVEEQRILRRIQYEKNLNLKLELRMYDAIIDVTQQLNKKDSLTHLKLKRSH